MSTLRIAALAALAGCFASCVSPRPTGVVQGEVVDALSITHDRGMTGVPSVFLATDLGIVGSTIGRGCTANGIGAAGGVLVGGVLGYFLEKSDAHRHIHVATIKLPDGRYYQVQTNLRDTPALHVGQRVWVATDPYGLPLHLIPTPPAT